MAYNEKCVVARFGGVVFFDHWFEILTDEVQKCVRAARWQRRRSRRHGEIVNRGGCEFAAAELHYVTRIGIADAHQNDRWQFLTQGEQSCRTRDHGKREVAIGHVNDGERPLFGIGCWGQDIDGKRLVNGIGVQQVTAGTFNKHWLGVGFGHGNLLGERDVPGRQMRTLAEQQGRHNILYNGDAKQQASRNEDF
jgi:hypothetical protein